jgi:hypothetical protein
MILFLYSVFVTGLILPTPVKRILLYFSSNMPDHLYFMFRHRINPAYIYVDLFVFLQSKGRGEYFEETGVNTKANNVQCHLTSRKVRKTGQYKRNIRFCVVTQRKVVIFRRFETPYRSQVQGSESPRILLRLLDS